MTTEVAEPVMMAKVKATVDHEGSGREEDEEANDLARRVDV